MFINIVILIHILHYSEEQFPTLCGRAVPKKVLLIAVEQSLMYQVWLKVEPTVRPQYKSATSNCGISDYVRSYITYVNLFDKCGTLITIEDCLYNVIH